MTRNGSLRVFCLVVVLASVGAAPARADPDLLAARAGHKTVLIKTIADSAPAEVPPESELQLVRYPSPAGDLGAYLSTDPKDGQKRPAIIWIFGGFDNGIGSTAWEPAAPANDQSASVYREFDVVMMYPSLRGGNGNPGRSESFYGEVDDVLAAAKFLAAQPHVDPKRIYLGGHSTGGTLALLVAETDHPYRAVFSFGPVSRASDYGQKNLAFDVKNKAESHLRSPIDFLGAIRNPTYVIEGASKSSNVDLLKKLAANNPPAAVRFIEVPGASHFSVLTPINRLIAQKIAADTGAVVTIELSPSEVADAVQQALK